MASPPGKPWRRGTCRRACLLRLPAPEFKARLGERDLLQFIEVFGLLASAFAENLIGEGEESAGGTDFLGIGSGREFPACILLRGMVVPRSRT